MIPECWSVTYEDLGVEGYEELMLKDSIERFELIADYLTEELGEGMYKCVGYAAEYDDEMVYLEDLDWEDVEKGL